MARKTRANQEEIVTVFYGINPKDWAVDRISATRGGKLSRYKGGHVYSHQTHSGYAVESEVRIVFELEDIFSTTPLFENSDYVKDKRGQLQAKADRMRVERETKRG